MLDDVTTYVEERERVHADARQHTLDLCRISAGDWPEWYRHSGDAVCDLEERMRDVRAAFKYTKCLDEIYVTMRKDFSYSTTPFREVQSASSRADEAFANSFGRMRRLFDGFVKTMAEEGVEVEGELTDDGLVGVIASSDDDTFESFVKMTRSVVLSNEGPIALRDYAEARATSFRSHDGQVAKYLGSVRRKSRVLDLSGMSEEFEEYVLDDVERREGGMWKDLKEKDPDAYQRDVDAYLADLKGIVRVGCKLMDKGFVERVSAQIDPKHLERVREAAAEEARLAAWTRPVRVPGSHGASAESDTSFGSGRI